mmetsp:Transcript_799/g.1794  ORF Transcript_799/g.1794 Transcript_799/m.1794 type:complete len:228 (+) Transcript_799:507-1190(+)
MYKALHHHRAGHIDVLNLLWRNILALRQLKDVLLAIHDLQLAIRQPDSDVPAVQPPLGVDGFGGLLRHLVVASEHVGTTVADLPTAQARDAALVQLVRAVGAQVAHVRNILQPHVVDSQGQANVADGGVRGPRHGGRRSALSLSVSLQDDTSKCDAQEIHDVRRDRGAPGHDDLAPIQPDLLTNLVEDNLVPHPMVDLIPFETLLLGCKPGFEQLLLDAPCLNNALS